MMTNNTVIPFTTSLAKRFETQLKKIYVGQSAMKKRRSILNNVNITDNGSVQITNSYVAAQLENTDAAASQLDQYPDMTKLFEVDRSRIDESVQIYWEDLKLLEDHLNVIYKQKIDNVKITLSNTGITIENAMRNNDAPFLKSEIRSTLLTDKDHSFNINPRYLHDCLMFFRQIYKRGYYIRVWTYKNNLIKFTYQELTYVIAPIRSY